MFGLNVLPQVVVVCERFGAVLAAVCAHFVVNLRGDNQRADRQAEAHIDIAQQLVDMQCIRKSMVR